MNYVIIKIQNATFHVNVISKFAHSKLYNSHDMKIYIYVVFCLLFYFAINLTCTAEKLAIYELPKEDSIINSDKIKIVNGAVQEVFTNYLNSILFYKKNFNSNSVMVYIDSYIERQNDTIEFKINTKFYIQRFGTTQKSWIDRDFAEVAALLKVRTLNRIKEISVDIDAKVLNTLNTTTNDKEALLEKEVRGEIKEN